MVALAMLLAKNPLPKYLSGVWLASNFLLYRWALWFWHVKSPCHCLGNVTDKLGLPPAMVNNLLLGIVGYLFIGGLVCLLFSRFQNEKGSGALVRAGDVN